MAKLRAYFRLLGMGWILFMHFSWLYLGNFFVKSKTARTRRIRMRWARHSVKFLGIDLEVHGEPSKEVTLYISNHRSLIDPLVMAAILHAYPLSKAEVGKYPLLGAAAKYTGIILVERKQSDSRSAALDAIRDHLAAGISVLIYPEGTTSDLPTTREFRPGSFKVAVPMGISITALAIVYADKRHHWIEGSLLDHFINRFGKRKTKIKLFIDHARNFNSVEDAVEQTRNWINAKIIDDSGQRS